MCDLVSIIMPAYNTAAFIEDSIRSVQSQSYKDWELIIVDDASCDDTSQILNKYLSDERIIYLKNKTNIGAAASRNRALREAKGRWIAFLDSDDLWTDDKLEKQIDFMKDRGYCFSYTNYTELDESGTKIGRTVTGPKKITRNGFYRYCWPGCLTVMYDQSKIGLIQIVDIKKNNDYAMWLQVSRKADCYLLDEDLAFYRRGRNGSISTNSIFIMLKWHYILFRDAEKLTKASAVFSTFRNIVFGIFKKIYYVKRKNH